MWAITQRDGRPAEYRWHPLSPSAQRRKVWLTPLLECRAVKAKFHYAILLEAVSKLVADQLRTR